MSASDRSFIDVYDEEVWGVYGFFAYRTASREVAEDLTQATFERALRAWSRFDPDRGSARTWLLAIGHNLLVDHYRRQSGSREEPIADDGPAEAGGSAGPEHDDRLGLSLELEAALGALNERERELIALRFGGDLTGPEIAELTELSLANVQQIISRALRKLRLELEQPVRAEASCGR